MSQSLGARIAIQGLRKSYQLDGRSIDVLKDLDLVVEAGEMVAVVGASGAGKSTFLHVLGTLDRIDSGSIVIDGVDVTGLQPGPLAAFRNLKIGFVFQFHHLLPEFTAIENVAMPALIAGEARRPAEERARGLLDRVGLSHRLAHRPGELSGGEQQRVALARALVMNPRLLLADEPTGNLDYRTGNAIHDLVMELNRERGMTMVVVTHNEDLAMRLPRRLSMLDGRVVDSPRPAPSPAGPSTQSGRSGSPAAGLATEAAS